LYDGPSEVDIYTRWDQISSEELICDDAADKSGVCDVHSMVHACNNEDTPIPYVPSVYVRSIVLYSNHHLLIRVNLNLFYLTLSSSLQQLY